MDSCASGLFPRDRLLGLLAPLGLATLLVLLRLPGPAGVGGAESAEDCNRNGIADSLDIRDGTSADCGRNGVPDECEPGPAFVQEVRAPAEASGDAGGFVAVTASVLLRTCGLTAGAPGLQGWFITVGATGGSVVAATVDGTVADAWPTGLQQGGWEHTGLAGSPWCGVLATSAVVLSLTGPEVTLDPGTSPHEVLRVTCSAEVPGVGEAALVVETHGEECGRLADLDELPRGAAVGADGEGADGGGSNAGLGTYGGLTVVLLNSRSVVRVSASAFRRGDVNSDGAVDISDAIRTFMVLFLGATEPGCLDACDSNDDGRVDISDGILVLNDFFIEGTDIPAPGPFDCGLDPTPDALACRDDAPCR